MLRNNTVEPVTLEHDCTGLLRDDETKEKSFAKGTQGQYKGHVPIGNVVLEIDGAEYIIPEHATDIR